jgi:hypothetical protein
MTDTLKPAELDLEALKKVALDHDAPHEHARPWERRSDYLVKRRNPSNEHIATSREYADYIANFDPPTVLSLLTRIEALEAERDALKLAICGGEDAPGYAASLSNEKILQVLKDNYASWKRDSELAWDGETANTWKARALSAEAQRDRMREALTALRNRVYQRTPSERWHLFQQAVENADAALSQGSGEEG